MSGLSFSPTPTSSPRSDKENGEAADNGHEKRSDIVKKRTPSFSPQASESLTSEEEASSKEKSNDQKPMGRNIVVTTSEQMVATVPSPKKRKYDEAEDVEMAETSKVTEVKNQPGKASIETAGEGSGSFAGGSRPRFPPYPRTGKIKDIREWQQQCAKIRSFYAKDPGNKFPTRREPKDPETTDAVQSTKDKEMVLSASRSIVSVSSIMDNGQRLPPCTGIIIKCPDSSERSTIIVTCSRLVSKAGKILNPLPKLTVGLADKKTLVDAELIHFSDHYDIALLSVAPNVPLESASIGQGPKYGQEVFVLARDQELSLRVRHGKIQWLEESDILRRDYYMFLTCDIPEGGSGGMVIDHDGKVRGMSFHCSPYTAILSISTIVTCVEMFMKFGRVARPILGFGIRTIALLDVELREEISNLRIKGGFYVEMVYGSAAEENGIERGIVITSINGQNTLTLPELEDYLLSFGWEHLKNNSTATKHFQLQVFDLRSRKTRDINLPVKFCDAAERRLNH